MVTYNTAPRPNEEDLDPMAHPGMPQFYDRYVPPQLPPEVTGDDVYDGFNTTLVPHLNEIWSSYWASQFRRVEFADYQEESNPGNDGIPSSWFEEFRDDGPVSVKHVDDDASIEERILVARQMVEDLPQRAYEGEGYFMREVVDPVEAALKEDPDMEVHVLMDGDITLFRRIQWGRRELVIPGVTDVPREYTSGPADRPWAAPRTREALAADWAYTLDDWLNTVVRPGAIVVPYLTDRHFGRVRVGMNTTNSQQALDRIILPDLNKHYGGFDRKLMISSKDGRFINEMDAEMRDIWGSMHKDEHGLRRVVALRDFLNPKRSLAYALAEGLVDFDHEEAQSVHNQSLKIAIALRYYAREAARRDHLRQGPLTVIIVDDLPEPILSNTGPVRYVKLSKRAQYRLPEDPQDVTW